MKKVSIESSNRHLIYFYFLIALVIVSLSCVWQHDDSGTVEGESRCIGSLLRKLGYLMYLWEWFPNWPRIHFFPNFVGSYWSAIAFGLAVTFFTWIVVKMDSTVPGSCPPSPLSPKKIRKASGHDFHLCYALAIVNGVTLGILAMGIPSG